MTAKSAAETLIDALAARARAQKHEIGKPCSVSLPSVGGVTIGASRVAGAVRFKVNGAYTSRAKAIEALVEVAP